jgi:hypothetical protein
MAMQPRPILVIFHWSTSGKSIWPVTPSRRTMKAISS